MGVSWAARPEQEVDELAGLQQAGSTWGKAQARSISLACHHSDEDDVFCLCSPWALHRPARPTSLARATGGPEGSMRCGQQEQPAAGEDKSEGKGGRSGGYLKHVQHHE